MPALACIRRQCFDANLSSASGTFFILLTTPTLVYIDCCVHSLLPRGDRPANDPIFALNQEANLRKSRGESIVNATVGVLLDDRGKLAILPTAMRALREVRDEDWAGYAPISGTSSFLDAVMDDLFAHRPTLRACASAVATPGGSGALRHAVCTFLEPGQAMLTTSLYWEPYGVFADENGRRIETFEMFEPRGTASQMYFDDLDRKLGDLLQLQGRALVVLNDPCHNPTGYTMSEHDWFEAARILGKHARGASIAVLLDAAYAAYASRGTRPALQALEPLLDRIPLFVAWSASKTFTQYGLRVGCLAAVVPDADERERVQRALGYACRGTW